MQTTGKKWLKRFIVLIPIIAVLLIAGVLIPNKTKPTQVAEDEEIRTLRVIEVKSVDFAPRITGYGVAEPETVWGAISQVKGTINDISPDLKSGALIPANTVLLKIDPTEYDVAISRLKANIETTLANINELKKEEENNRQLLDIEQRSLKLAQKLLERKETLYKNKTIPRTELDQEEKSFLIQQANFQKLENTLNLLPAKIKALQANLTALQANLKQGELDREKTEIRAPYDCRLGEVDLEVGQYIQTGQLLFEAHNTDTTIVEAQFRIDQLRSFLNLSRPDVENIKISTDTFTSTFGNIKAVVRLRSGDWSTEWEARVDRIREAMDTTTRTMTVIVAVDKPYDKAIPGVQPPLTGGMFCEVELQTPAYRPSILIPRSALHGDTVYILDNDNRLQPRKVDIDFISSDLVMIKTGMNSGDQLIVSNPSPAITGMKVSPVPDTELSAQLLSESQRKAVKK